MKEREKQRQVVNLVGTMQSIGSVKALHPGRGRKRTDRHPNPEMYQPRKPNQEEPREGEPQNQARARHNGRKASVHSPGTEAARAMQVSRQNVIGSLGVRRHAKACAALGLEAERATAKHLGTQVSRTCMHALGTGYARNSVEHLGFQPKEGTCASTGAHPPSVTNTSRPRRSAFPVLPRGYLVGGRQSPLAGCKPPPLFMRRASSCPSQGQRHGETWGASPQPRAPTYLPTYLAIGSSGFPNINVLLK